MSLIFYCLFTSFAWSAVSVPNSYDSWRRDLDCFIDRGHSLRLKDSHVDKYLAVTSLDECKKECDLTFINCKSFSYNHAPDDVLEANCLLSREDGSILDVRDFFRDFDRRIEFSFYERVKRSLCDPIVAGHGNVLNRRIISLDFPWRDDRRSSECFRLVRTSSRVSQRYVMKTLRTRDRSECEAECSAARDFTCRAFNYRKTKEREAGRETYKALPSALYMENCELSSQDTYGVTLDDKYVFYSDPDFDFYERTGFGRNCEGKSKSWDSDNYGSNSDDYREECFELHEKERRIDSRIVKDRRRVRDLQACKQECLRARNYECKSLAFSYSSSGSTWRGQDNCYLSDRATKYYSRYDAVYDKAFDLYDREDDRNCRAGPGSRGTGDFDPYGREGGFETVSGKKCYRDPCREDRYGRFFFCETDESGGWDYCCRPGTTCSDPTGDRYFWCHVGNELSDQWRPCTMPIGGGGRGRPLGGMRDFLLEASSSEAIPPEDPTLTNGTIVVELRKDSPVEFKDISDLDLEQ